MQITVTRHDSIVVIEPAGLIDAKASAAFEKQVLGHLAAGTQQAIIDLAKVEILTSHGIRVLMLIAQRLQAVDGALVLCALSEQMRSTFEVAGLGKRFRFAATRTEALAQLSASAGSSRAPVRSTSKLSRLVARLVEDTDETVRVAPTAVPPLTGRSELARRVASLLAADEGGQPGPPAPSGQA